MKKVRREDIVDYVTYEEQRDAFRSTVLTIKEARRIHLGESLTFLFENTDTMRYQIQEMMRAERIVKETDIQHEIDTYNELLGDSGELGCTLLIEIDDPQERDTKLRQWHNLPEHLYAVLEDGTQVPVTYDPRQVGDEKVSSVQYLKIKTGGRTPVSLGCKHPELSVESPLNTSQKSALTEDLQGDPVPSK
ncbi:MAG: DUF3501 family protein [SAR324 cluster bacterium]|nr:DUF3501 family protein [SAR324 cluster bacterium]